MRQGKRGASIVRQAGAGDQDEWKWVMIQKLAELKNTIDWLFRERNGAMAECQRLMGILKRLRVAANCGEQISDDGLIQHVGSMRNDLVDTKAERDHARLAHGDFVKDLAGLFAIHPDYATPSGCLSHVKGAIADRNRYAEEIGRQRKAIKHHGELHVRLLEMLRREDRLSPGAYPGFGDTVAQVEQFVQRLTLRAAADLREALDGAV